ncbi:MAG: hypothetical protein NZ529_10295 [Cytophagaceae bacterium]|nr:hypothetical protein [Cytophagaceae bacterium]MDW8457175.1 hypothetical protein [Cytophagaceae bacterium]
MRVYLSILAITTILSSLMSCKRTSKDKPWLGKNYKPASANFTITEPLVDVIMQNTTVYTNINISNFSSGIYKNFFRAKFNEEVSWQLTITGSQTGAERVIEGLSSFLDSINTKWDGGPTNNRFFKTSEKLYVKLTILGSDIVQYDTLTLAAAKPYHKRTYNNVFYYIVDDFDGANDSTKMSSFYPDLNDLGGGNGGNNAYNGNKVQGSFSYRMYGKDVNNNTYIGSCSSPTLLDVNPGIFKQTNPDSVYFNMYIYGFGYPSTTVSIITYENDQNYSFTANPRPTFDQTKNDKWLVQIPVEWTGWKLVSVPYRLFKKPNTGGGLGNNQLNPEKITGFALELDSYPMPGMYVEALIDMFTITQNGVFKP